MRPGVPEHGALRQIVAQDRARGPQGRTGQDPGRAAAQQPRRAEGQDGAGGSARPDVQEVHQVGGARDHHTGEQFVRRARLEQRARGEPGGADAEQLHRPAGDLLPAQRREVRPESAPGVAGAEEVVVRPAAPGGQHRQGGGAPGAGGQSRCGGGGERGTRGRREPGMELDRAPRVVRAVPPGGPARWPPPQRPVGGPGRPRRREHRRDPFQHRAARRRHHGTPLARHRAGPRSGQPRAGAHPGRARLRSRCTRRA